MNLTLRIWRQKNGQDKGGIVEFPAKDISPDMSFLEMLDVVNEELTKQGVDPIAFDSDCREGICGACSLVINGIPHGPAERGTAVCQLHMRKFKDGDTITIEPWRAKPFPIIKDLVCDRRSFDRIIQAGGFVSINTGGAPDAERAMDAALQRRGSESPAEYFHRASRFGWAWDVMQGLASRKRADKRRFGSRRTSLKTL